PGFRREGFEITALFDVADAKIGDESRSGVPIYDIRELKRVVRKERIDIAVIAVPAESAQPVLDQVVSAGVKAVLNFSPGALKAPAGMKLKNVDLTVSLESLSFYLAQGIDPDCDEAPPQSHGRAGQGADGGRQRQAGHRSRGRRPRDDQDVGD